jgi:hypothetical protein
MKRILVLSALALAACAPKEEMPATDAPTVSAEVTLALAVAAGIDLAPASADSVLTANGLTRLAFDSLLYRIASDSTMSKQYNAGRP